MAILPLQQFEADLEEDRKIYEKLKPPTSIVVRFGVLKMIGEFPYDGDSKPGCGSKIVVRTHRGTEMSEMLTSTCPNAGCSKSVTRKEMLEYIDNSGGKDYPFFNQGKVLRIATVEDLNEQARLDGTKRDLLNFARMAVKELSLPIKVVDVEPLLGGERVTFYFTSEDRVDFRDLVSRLAGQVRTRIEMRQIGARDEARVTADYEKCGQHCCCKQFLKVLKPVSMKSAKVQKATLDPLKISGRCGRLMCCLRYEDQSYTELQKRLPKRKWRVETSEGTGIVLDGQILTQLVLVRLDRDGSDIAVPVEELTVLGPPAPPGPMRPMEGAPANAPPPPHGPQRDNRPPQGGRRDGRGPDGRGPGGPGGGGGDRPDRGRPGGGERRPSGPGQGPGGPGGPPNQGGRGPQTGAGPNDGPNAGPSTGPRPPRPARPAQPPAPPMPRDPVNDEGADGPADIGGPDGGAPGGEGGGKKRRRRRRRRGGGEGGAPGAGGPSDSGGGGDGGGGGGGPAPGGE